MTTFYRADHGQGEDLISHGSVIYRNGKSYMDMSSKELQSLYNRLSGGWGQVPGSKGDVARAFMEQIRTRKGDVDALDQQALFQRQMAEYMAHQQSYQAQMAEYQEQMNGFLDKMAETMAAEEPAAEPLKAAAEVQSAARADTSRKQLLRRGLMSTMTRYGGNGQQQKLGA